MKRWFKHILHYLYVYPCTLVRFNRKCWHHKFEFENITVLLIHLLNTPLHSFIFKYLDSPLHIINSIYKYVRIMVLMNMKQGIRMNCICWKYVSAIMNIWCSIRLVTMFQNLSVRSIITIPNLFFLVGVLLYLLPYDYHYIWMSPIIMWCCNW